MTTHTAERTYTFEETVDSYAGLDTETLRSCWHTLKNLLAEATTEEAKRDFTFHLNAVETAGKRKAQPKPQPVVPVHTATGPSAFDAMKAAAAKLPALPKASYAIREDGRVNFYQVDKPARGRWSGYTFLAIQASDDLHKIKSYERMARVFETIAADAEGAMALYGHELGECGACHRTLTDPESIARGIGPVCARKAGF